MPKTTKRSPAQRAAWARLSPWMKRKIRKSPLSVWARRIRREYKSQCAWCSKKRSLEAHHIFFKHLFPEREEDLDNGVLLCLKCHDKIHSLYIANEKDYWKSIAELVKKRVPMSSISRKKRNPSLFDYSDLKPEP